MAKNELTRWFTGIGGLRSGEALSEPEDADSRVRRAIDAVPVVLFEFDASGTYTSVAGGLIETFGIEPAQVIGRSVFDYPKFVPGKNMMVRRALAGESVSFGGLWPRGRFTMRLEPRKDASGRVIGVIGHGVETAKPAPADAYFEELLNALQRSEQRFRVMCESAPMGIYVSTPRLDLGYVNPALCGLLGRGPDTLLGRPWQTLLHRDEVVAQPTAAGLSRLVRLARSDGSAVWTALRMSEMRDDGEIVGYVGLVADVTEERAARLASERARQDLRSVIESSPEGIAVVRGERFVFVNRALVELLGYASTGELMGRPLTDVLHPDDHERARTGYRGGTAPCCELRYRKADGEYALLEISAAELREFDGAPAQLLSARDVTLRRQLEAQSLLTERLVSMGMLAAGIAHEINNPLAALLSQLEWAASRLAAQPAALEVAPAIAHAREAAERVRTIVRDLKLFARAEEDASGPVDLRAVLDSAVRMAWNELRHRARFVRDYGELPLVRGSEARLGQVFLNLLINAAHAIPEGCADAHEIALIARAEESRWVVVEVRDSGCGIAADVLPRVFDPFFTTKPAGLGSGLGLSICQRIVASLNGNIEVESQVGRGSVFRVSLAVAEPGELRVPAPASLAQVTSGVRGRVLVIDDDPAMGSAIELVLAEEHEVEVLTSARNALARLHAGQRYDAIVCDVMMPEMSGIDFHAELAGSWPEIAAQVIFLTGGAFTRRARDFLDRVENPRLHKPFESRSLRALVSQCVSRA